MFRLSWSPNFKLSQIIGGVEHPLSQIPLRDAPVYLF